MLLVLNADQTSIVRDLEGGGVMTMDTHLLQNLTPDIDTKMLTPET